MLDIQKVIEEAREKLSEEKSDYKIIVHPSVISYDYRIAWTWEEMDKRNEYNNNVDKIRYSFWLPWRPYWKPLYSEWASHRWKDRPLKLKFEEWW